MRHNAFGVYFATSGSVKKSLSFTLNITMSVEPVNVHFQNFTISSVNGVIRIRTCHTFFHIS